MKAELKLQIKAQPGLSELEELVAILEQVLADAPHLRLKVLDLLFTLSDGSLKPGFVELVAIPAFGTDGHSVIELQVTNRLRELVGALAAGDVEVLGID
ncbi:hypothetical protein CKQ80_23760 [Pseudomonas moraviensis]|uniref:Uncharacterized protein n=1 Tax=Pseudomonas moraviensis TaxID=321662 RepID=A0A2A2PRA4_9PSED|nr:hypothetical protein [Pseudomonas moraviensis]PAW51679.1 hypothetical protein CKQ68_05450 [Pseudomonas moraviensis]PAW58196.1 hypothetical protein CKQ80_23760 [Pseudomonas moraviensis]